MLTVSIEDNRIGLPGESAFPQSLRRHFHSNNECMPKYSSPAEQQLLRLPAGGFIVIAEWSCEYS